MPRDDVNHARSFYMVIRLEGIPLAMDRKKEREMIIQIFKRHQRNKERARIKSCLK